MRFPVIAAVIVVLTAATPARAQTTPSADEKELAAYGPDDAHVEKSHGGDAHDGLRDGEAAPQIENTYLSQGNFAVGGFA